MGLLETVQNAASTAVSVVSDLAYSGTFIQLRDPTYNTATQTYSSTNHAYSIIKGIIVSEYTDSEQVQLGVATANRSILIGDRKMLIPAQKLPIDPTVGDLVTDLGRGTERLDGDWVVVDVGIDPAKALWTLQVRKT